MANPMGEATLEPLRVDFDRRVKLERFEQSISPREHDWYFLAD